MSPIENPWKTLQTEIKYDNPWIQVTESQVLNPSGNPGIYGKVHFKNRAIGIIPLDEANNTWIVGQYRYVLDRYSWEIPEGGGDLNVSSLTSAQRELLEETGIVAGSWKEVLKMHLSNSVCDEEGLIYVARQLEFKAPQPEDNEQLEIRKIPFSELYGMVMKGLITDALAVAGVLKVKILLDEGQL